MFFRLSAPLEFWTPRGSRFAAHMRKPLRGSYRIVQNTLSMHMPWTMPHGPKNDIRNPKPSHGPWSVSVHGPIPWSMVYTGPYRSKQAPWPMDRGRVEGLKCGPYPAGAVHTRSIQHGPYMPWIYQIYDIWHIWDMPWHILHNRDFYAYKYTILVFFTCFLDYRRRSNFGPRAEAASRLTCGSRFAAHTG